jgi:hypothetical protein
MVDLKTAKKAELDAELELYKGVNVGIPELKNNKEKVAFIEELQKEYGIPKVATQEDIDSGLYAPQLEIGDTIMTSLEAENDATDGDDSDDEAEDAKEETTAGEAKIALGVQLFEGKVVTETRNTIVNGRRYVEVFTAETSHLITPEEVKTKITNA